MKNFQRNCCVQHISEDFACLIQKMFVFRLRHLNLTNNCLTELPPTNAFADLNRLQFLRLSGNVLSESCMSTIVSCRKLRLLDVSYNNFRFFNDRFFFYFGKFELLIFLVLCPICCCWKKSTSAAIS